MKKRVSNSRFVLKNYVIFLPWTLMVCAAIQQNQIIQLFLLVPVVPGWVLGLFQIAGKARPPLFIIDPFVYSKRSIISCKNTPKLTNTLAVLSDKLHCHPCSRCWVILGYLNRTIQFKIGRWSMAKLKVRHWDKCVCKFDAPSSMHQTWSDSLQAGQLDNWKDIANVLIMQCCSIGSQNNFK